MNINLIKIDAKVELAPMVDYCVKRGRLERQISKPRSQDKIFKLIICVNMVNIT